MGREGLSSRLKLKLNIKVLFFSLPPMSYPNFELLDNVLLDSIIIGIVAYAVNVSVAKAFAKKNNYKIDPNQVRYAGVKVVS